MRYMDVSENSGTPKSSILIGFSIINHPFWGTPISGNTHIEISSLQTILGYHTGSFGFFTGAFYGLLCSSHKLPMPIFHEWCKSIKSGTSPNFTTCIHKLPKANGWISRVGVLKSLPGPKLNHFQWTLNLWGLKFWNTRPPSVFLPMASMLASRVCKERVDIDLHWRGHWYDTKR